MKTLLDEFAMTALNALISGKVRFFDIDLKMHEGKNMVENYAINSYEIAKAMMEERKKHVHSTFDFKNIVAQKAEKE